ncbi:MAG: response regulator transcription factor [Candidatus Microthrix subdominans]|uniref:Response regulator transcription factor n=1 Tax=Candidatus Neomicrothrix subdominans TaxID=2954438 RepID=A0A936NEA2_9ACTN|nr:response regulator transcription factor [Candidatus Microthrix sp.]MBK9298743.1 response regulator transcription factor [Candidatus Microthrix subdominans]MBK6312361.1 response regulator transcription factor [Candidatus Microthrix sp.]MBK6439489.1 response regulator transcription factor [Candidatus Microthrix sp.]MBK6969423.1 response regulator transcription factor [Candidatus Microthrix sp.]MBK7167238.1 response regulator transcription factor [Candidatus Microthrix sp.]
MRILVVEDEVELAAAVARGLREEGFDVDVTHDGKDGYERARSATYDAIVLDILLPGMNGFQVCRSLREAGVWTPILMLTAKEGEYDEAEALDTGADDFLRKPFSYVVLIARLRALTRRVSEGALAPVMVGGLELDPVGRKVRRDGTDIALSPREYGLLEVLMRRAGETVSKRELLEQVWGQDFAGDPNVVEVYVGYLRRKIDRPFGREDLRTVRGSGYVLGEAPADRGTKPDADSDTAGA